MGVHRADSWWWWEALEAKSRTEQAGPPNPTPPAASEPEDTRVAMGKEKSQKPTLFTQRIKKKMKTREHTQLLTSEAAALPAAEPHRPPARPQRAATPWGKPEPSRAEPKDGAHPPLLPAGAAAPPPASALRRGDRRATANRKPVIYIFLKGFSVENVIEKTKEFERLKSFELRSPGRPVLGRGVSAVCVAGPCVSAVSPWPKRLRFLGPYITSRSQRCFGCEGDLAATSVTPLIARVDSADLAG